MKICMSSSRLFGTSGVRGRIDKRLTPELAVKLSRAFAYFLGESGAVAIGRDVRLHSRILSEACIAGFLSCGVDVIDCGVLPTPALLQVTKEFALNGAVMITASHIPPQYAGVLFFLGDTAELGREESVVLESLVREDLKCSSLVSLGEVTAIDAEDVLEIYLSSATRFVNIKRVRGFGSKVVLDLCNSAQSLFLPFVAMELGCEVFCINDFLSGYFPGRGADLHPKLLKSTTKLLTEIEADFALATDGDGDRCLFIDELGKVLWGDVAGCLFSREELLRKGGGVVVCPVNTSNLVLHVVEKSHGDVFFTRIGPPEIASSIKSTSGVIFAFEESGKYIWPENILYGDPALALGKLLEILCEYDSLSKAVEVFPKFHQVKYNVPCPSEIKDKVLDYLEVKVLDFKCKEIVDVDGLKIIFDDDSWLFLRPSGTEPVFRVFSESLDAEYAEELALTGLNIVREVIRKLSK